MTMKGALGAPRTREAMAALQDHAAEAAALLKALANDQRLLILCALLDGPLSVGQINERVPLSQSALSQHLGVLRDAALVTTTRHSQTIYYALTQGPALEIMRVLYTAFCAPPASERFATRVKRKLGRRS
ncbi:MAG TPA: metalloregulator ArsR/SmtB family transcription factor [Steroidobacteraceae bacterium]|nr:metalloregulator ArsR/SmtB family transcription factor [Steroidobacteraceae bacterium]